MQVLPTDTKTHDTIPWARVNVDGLIANPMTGMGVLECKSHGQYIFRDIKAMGLPMSHILQIHQGMLVHGVYWGAIAILHPDSFDFIHFNVERDEKIIEIIKEEGAKFWEMVEKNEIPDRLDASDKRCSKCVFRTQCQGQALLDAYEEYKDDGTFDGVDYESLVLELMDAKNVTSVAKAEEAEIAGRVKLVMANIPSMRSAGVKLIHVPQERVTFNSRKFKEDYPDIYEQYTKFSVSRPLRTYDTGG